MTLGGLQKLVVQDRVLPGRRFLLAGSSPLLFPVAKSLLDAGAEIVAFCDATKIKDHMRMIPQLLHRKSMVHEAAAYVFPVFKASLPTYRPYAVVAAQGTARVEEVTIAKLDKEWKPIPGTEKPFNIDVVGLNYGYLPSSRLARLCGCVHVYDPIQICWKPETDRFMRSSIPEIYVAGDSTGIAGADMAEVQGRIAATHIAAELGRLSSLDLKVRLRSLDKIQTRLQKYASVLNSVYSLRPGLYRVMDKKTIVCRCEQVTVEEVLAGIEWGYRNINEIKRMRAGLGLCQGRTCESATAQLMIEKGIAIEEIGYMSTRPPLSPIPLASLEHWVDSENGQNP
jgi:bacterioferritin-associated ferredoxin